MNFNEKNIVAENQLRTQETSSQNEDLSPDETMITSSLQAGINYCRYMAEQMHEEIKILQEKWNSTRQTNRVLKQNMVNLENEKQRYIANFQEEFRKYDSLNGCVKELEEQMLSLKKLLETCMKLEDDFSQSKIEELKIRSNIKALLEEQETELQRIESFFMDRKMDIEEKCKTWTENYIYNLNVLQNLRSIVH